MYGNESQSSTLNTQHSDEVKFYWKLATDQLILLETLKIVLLKEIKAIR